MVDPSKLLMIHPAHLVEPEIVIDAITMKMAGALKNPAEGSASKGWHTCRCGATSGNVELFVKLDDRFIETNSLAVHYLACHRGEVPQSEIDKVERLKYEPMMPTPKMIARLPIYEKAAKLGNILRATGKQVQEKFGKKK